MARRKNTSTFGAYALLIGICLLLVGAAVWNSTSGRELPYNPRQSIVKLTSDSGTCSGVRISGDLIITNAHCVDELSTVTIETEYGLKDDTAEVLWRGKYAD